MNSRILSKFLAPAALLVAAGMAGAATQPAVAEPGEAAASKQVRHEILMYPQYTLWDDINYQVSNGNVTLIGAVTEPYKKSDLGHIVQRIPGVTSVTNQLQVLPLSPMDNQLRLQVARAIFRDPVLSQYSVRAVPPIHIIVDNGHVSLEGVVRTQMEKDVAGLRASSAGLSFGPVVNNLRVEQTPSKRG